MNQFHAHEYSIRQLQYAVAVADLGGFGRAAKACGVSQPSLSAQVARLEEALGVQLFERQARGVLPTQAGAALLPRMRQVLLMTRELDEATRSLLDPASLVLQVGVIPTVAPYLLPRVTELLSAGAARPRVRWREATTAACEAALAAGEVDAILVADPPALAGAADVEVGFEPFVLIGGADCALTAPVTQREVLAEELLLLDEEHCLRGQTLAYCQSDAAEAPFRATSLSTLVQMVATHQGVSLVPASAVPVETRRAAIRALRLAEPVPGRTLRLIWRGGSPHGEALTELAALFTEALAGGVAEAGV